MRAGIELVDLLLMRLPQSISVIGSWPKLCQVRKRENKCTQQEVIIPGQISTGVEVPNKEAQVVFEKAGCWVDGNRVRISSALSEWAVSTAPSRVTVCDRNGKRALRLETTNAFYGPEQSNMYVIDPLTGKRRKPVKGDVVKKNVDFACSWGCNSQDYGNCKGLDQAWRKRWYLLDACPWERKMFEDIESAISMPSRKQ